VSPKKAYAIDAGLARANSVSFSEDKGRVLENLVFLSLRKKYKDIYYFKEENDDFLVREKGKITKAIQVCYELNEDNKDREISGLREAMNKFNLKQGIIITLSQKDKFKGIEVKPAWKYMLEK